MSWPKMVDRENVSQSGPPSSTNKSICFPLPPPPLAIKCVNLLPGCFLDTHEGSDVSPAAAASAPYIGLLRSLRGR